MIGFQKQKNYFKQALVNGRLTHAYLFSGPEMIGKKKFAQEVFQLLNDRPVSENEPDFRLLSPKITEGESKIYIEDIRDLKAFISLSAHRGPYKFVIIDDADTLTGEASNALLKLLEEPPAMTVFILVSSRPKQLLPTITSRCQEIRFLPHDAKVIEEVLAEHRMSAEDRATLAILAEGRLGWALSICEQKRVDEIKKTIAEFQSVLKQGISGRFNFAKKMIEDEEYAEKINIWLRWARAKGKDPVKTKLVVRHLMNLSHIVSQPQYNHKLALENFLASV